MTIFLLLFLGASIGSFLGLVAERFPDQSIISPSSHCQSCQTPLKVWDLIPILSQIWQKSSCRYCHSPIPLWYAGWEGLCGLVVLLAGLGYLTWAEAWLWLLGGLLSLYDLKDQSYPILVWLVGSLPLFIIQGLPLPSLVLLLLAILAQVINIRMGSGDLLYLASLGLVLDLQGLVWIIQISSLAGILYFMTCSDKKKTIAFLPFLLLAFSLILLFIRLF